MRVSLPWPPYGLSPNDRVHWRTKAQATKRYRFTAATLAREAGWHMLSVDITELRVTFSPDGELLQWVGSFSRDEVLGAMAAATTRQSGSGVPQGKFAGHIT